MHTYQIQGFTYELRDRTLPGLTAAIEESGAWILERTGGRRASDGPHATLLFELPLRQVLDAWSALATVGVELSRSGRQTLIDLCARRNHLARRPGATTLVRIHLEVRFLEDAPLATVLAGRSSMM